MQQNAKHSRPNVLPQPEQSGHTSWYRLWQ